MIDAVMKYISENIDKTLRFNDKNDGTLFGVPKPYNVPCVKDSFDELYYWDTYFLNKGLIALGKIGQAKNNCLDIKYLIDQFGYMPNGNRTFFMGASQPPYFAMMVDDVFAVTQDKEFLKDALGTIKKEYSFWMTKRVCENGLNVYGSDRTPEAHAVFFREIARERLGLADSSDETYAGANYAAEAESGWDFNPRFGGKCTEFNPIDLNCNLYEYEVLIGRFEKLLDISDGEIWKGKARLRAGKINELLWDEERKIYCDYCYVCKSVSTVASAAAFWPYWFGVAPDNRKSGAKNLFKLLDVPFGIAATEQVKNNIFQWSYPAVWAPLQLGAYMGLKNAEQSALAESVAEKYLRLVSDNFIKTGDLWEKFNGENGSVYKSSEYETPKMMGWTAGVYLYFHLNNNRIEQETA